jgi:hypothetical protein
MVDTYGYKYALRICNNYCFLTAKILTRSRLKFTLQLHRLYCYIYIVCTSVRGTLLVAQLVEALRYKPEGRGLESRCCHWNFSLT